MSELGLKCFIANGHFDTTTHMYTVTFYSRAHGTSRANSFAKPHIKLVSNSACGHCASFSSGSLTTRSSVLWDSGVGLWSHFCPLSQDTVNGVFTGFMSLHQEGRWHLAQHKACHYQGNLPGWFEPAERACAGPACSLMWLQCFGSSTNSPKDSFMVSLGWGLCLNSFGLSLDLS